MAGPALALDLALYPDLRLPLAGLRPACPWQRIDRAAIDGSTPSRPSSRFSATIRRRLRRGVFRSLADLQAAIHRYIAEHNDDPAPFVWAKTADQIVTKRNRLNASVH